MFEIAWSKLKSKHVNSISGHVKNEFIDLSKYISNSSFLLWEEHCVECAPPICYSTCPLYVARGDKKCSRFVDGINKVPSIPGGDGFAVYIEFRRWAKLETQWPRNTRQFKLKYLRRLTAFLNNIERIVTFISTLLIRIDRKRKLNEILYWVFLKAFPFISESTTEKNNDGFFFQFYSLNNESSGFQFELYDKNGVHFRTRFAALPGLNQYFIPQTELPSGLFRARLWNEGDFPLRVIISWLHIIKLCASTKRQFLELVNFRKIQTKPFDEKYVLRGNPARPHIKCLVFDLDNTLWNGVIGDLGVAGVQINPLMIGIIKELDKRGIICSVCSKNDFDIAWQKIQELGLEDYFLFPQINWLPKSENIKTISREMNIGIQEIALIDDSLFERIEVSRNCPEVRCYDVLDAENLLSLQEFNPEVSNFSSNRRMNYLTENRRMNFKSKFTGDIDEFLKSCEMKITFLDPKENYDRCYELLMRSNQFNISGLKYEKEEFSKMLSINQSICWSVSDKYGDYGVVGFLNWELNGSDIIITDFVMSCRVAEKRVEETVFGWFSDSIANNGDFALRFTKTDRNNPIFQKLKNIGCSVSNTDTKTSLLTLKSDTISKYPSVMQVIIVKSSNE